MATDSRRARLLIDIGGTNIRFALGAEDGEFADVEAVACADFDEPEAAIRYYLGQPGRRSVTEAAVAIAGPVGGDVVRMTNHPWSFSIAEMRQRLGLERLEVINDFAALALAVPRLGNGDRDPIGGGEARTGAPVAVIGPGTGLGVSALIPVRGGWRAVATEGGHVTMAAADDREQAVLATLRQRFGHVSAERVISGPGLVNLYRALAALDGAEAEADIGPDDITRRAADRSCPLCARTVEMFAAMLGTVAGDLALVFGARGGVYIAGGIVPALGGDFPAAVFRRRFDDKGRFADYLRAVPVFIITHPYPAFLGLASLLAGGDAA